MVCHQENKIHNHYIKGIKVLINEISILKFRKRTRIHRGFKTILLRWFKYNDYIIHSGDNLEISTKMR
jgi:hypothetical protein